MMPPDTPAMSENDQPETMTNTLQLPRVTAANLRLEELRQEMAKDGKWEAEEAAFIHKSLRTFVQHISQHFMDKDSRYIEYSVLSVATTLRMLLASAYGYPLPLEHNDLLELLRLLRDNGIPQEIASGVVTVLSSAMGATTETHDEDNKDIEEEHAVGQSGDSDLHATSIPTRTQVSDDNDLHRRDELEEDTANVAQQTLDARCTDAAASLNIAVSMTNQLFDYIDPEVIAEHAAESSRQRHRTLLISGEHAFPSAVHTRTRTAEDVMGAPGEDKVTEAGPPEHINHKEVHGTLTRPQMPLSSHFDVERVADLKKRMVEDALGSLGPSRSDDKVPIDAALFWTERLFKYYDVEGVCHMEDAVCLLSEGVMTLSEICSVPMYEDQFLTETKDHIKLRIRLAADVAMDGDCSVLADVFETFPGDLSRPIIKTSHGGTIDELCVAYAASRHQQAIEKLEDAIANKDAVLINCLWQQMGFTSRDHVFSGASRDVVAIILHERLQPHWSKHEVENHLRIARLYGQMHRLSKVMVLLQPKGTHDSIVEMKGAWLHEMLQFFRLYATRLIEMLDPLTDNVLARLEHPNPDESLELNLNLFEDSESTVHVSLADIMNQVDEVYIDTCRE